MQSFYIYQLYELHGMISLICKYVLVHKSVQLPININYYIMLITINLQEKKTIIYRERDRFTSIQVLDIMQDIMYINLHIDMQHQLGLASVVKSRSRYPPHLGSNIACDMFSLSGFIGIGKVLIISILLKFFRVGQDISKKKNPRR
jgi:hypothetical protein